MARGAAIDVVGGTAGAVVVIGCSPLVVDSGRGGTVVVTGICALVVVMTTAFVVAIGISV